MTTSATIPSQTHSSNPLANESNEVCECAIQCKFMQIAEKSLWLQRQQNITWILHVLISECHFNWFVIYIFRFNGFKRTTCLAIDTNPPSKNTYSDIHCDVEWKGKIVMNEEQEQERRRIVRGLSLTLHKMAKLQQQQRQENLHKNTSQKNWVSHSFNDYFNSFTI